jgi:hypothetical protein
MRAMSNGIFVAGLLVGAAVAGAIVLPTQSAPGDAAVRPARGVPGDTSAVQHVPADAVADRLQRWVATSLARPLFNVDRRPVASTESGTNAATALPRLSGIMITQAGRRAIFAPTGAGKPQVVVEGGTVGGNLVQSITLEEVVLIGPDGPHKLHLAFDQASPGAMAMPPVIGGQGAVQETAAGGTAPGGITPGGITPGGTTP